jgi:hypothetical protein
MDKRNVKNSERSGANISRIHRIGGFTALLTVAVAFAEGAINFLPGGSGPTETVLDWFALLQSNWFMGIRNLGFMNLFMVALGIPMYFALYTAHRKVDKEFAALAMIVSFVGGAIFFATNRAFSLLELSRLHAQAATDAQRALFESAGQALLSVGRSHCPGTFVGFFSGTWLEFSCLWSCFARKSSPKVLPWQASGVFRCS